MGLATSYTIHLLTLCAHEANGSTDCTSPHIGFSFNPGSDLSLDSTSLQSTYSQDLLDALSNYQKVNKFLGPGYLVGVILLLLATMSNWFTGRSLAAGIFASLFGFISTILFFAASIASVLIFKKVNDTYNANFNSSGLTSSLGNIPIILSFVASVFALLSASSFILHTRNPGSSGRGGNRVRFHGVGGEGKARGIVTGEEAMPLTQGMGGNEPKPGVWGRMPTFGRQRYVQVEKQPALVRTEVHSQQAVIVDGSEHDPEESVRRRLDDDWAAHDEYSHTPPSHGSDPHSSIPMLTMGDDRRSMEATAYEPFKDTAT